ncbi:uncharacterized protein LOC116295108 [Actinia tenebrosa]|uniref:Uncharacterized protein LOC116295108 n=1 Tax=Actinia tenebrosa TaxID=6105 RepID=A0A6P8HTY0_ACTTE|nr:uncharacterized protein LOC116295108 [Actinia tenebrosa]
MPETENPRTFIRPKPIPVPPHRGLKITARNSTIYTCEIPNRKQVAHENYTRRTHQMTKCGYRSVNYKPYQSIGDVILDDKKLILTALGQDGDQFTQFQDHSDSSSSDSDSDDERTQSRSPLAKDQQPSVPQATSYKPKNMNDIRAQVSKGRKRINAVKLGFGLYRIVKEEQERKQAVVDEERRKKEEAAKSEMKPPSSDDEESDDDDIDDELKSLIIPLPPSPTLNTDRSFEDHLDPTEKSDRPDTSSSTSSNQRWKKIHSTVGATRTPATPTVKISSETPPESPVPQDMEYSRSSTDFFVADRRNVVSAPSTRQRSFLAPPKSAKSASSLTGRRSRKARSPRPYSPVYSNINYEDSTDRINVYRQLCALLWILEAMSQDQQPAVMPPITSCWKLKLLNEDSRFIRKRAEKDKTTEKDWTLFKQDPNRFTQRSTSRRGTRRISIHPNFLQRLSNTGSSGGSNPRPNIPVIRLSPGEMSRSHRGSVVGEPTTAAAHVEFDASSHRNGDDICVENPTSENPKIPDDVASVSFNEPVIRAVSAPPPAQASPPTNGSPAEKKSKLQRQKSFTVTTVYTPPANASRAFQKIRAKNRAAKAFKSSLSQKELDKLSGGQEDQQTRRDSRVSAWVQATGAINAKRFAAAAIAAFGTITLDHHVDKVPVEMKSKFEEVAEEKALVLHDNLEIRDRNRLQILERKLMCLEMFNSMYKALDKMRSKSVVFDDETNEEMRQRVSEECKWYKDLIDNLPEEVKDDLCCTLVLNKLASYGSLEGRKISSSQFIKVLSTLRVWEICSPDISAAIEFVREKVVEMSEEDYEEWFHVTFPQPKRAASAPPSRSSAFRY